MAAQRQMTRTLLLWSIPVGIALAVVFIAISLIWTIATGGKYVGQQDTAPETTPAPVASATATGPSAATGCISQATSSAGHLLETQQRATQDPAGAAEFAGAWMRWTLNDPIEGRQEVLQATVLNPGAMETQMGADKAGPATTASLNGAFYRSSMPSAADAWVDLGMDWSHAQAPDDKNSAFGSFHLIWRDGHWMVDIAAKPEQDLKEFATGMVFYASGC